MPRSPVCRGRVPPGRVPPGRVRPGRVRPGRVRPGRVCRGRVCRGDHPCKVQEARGGARVVRPAHACRTAGCGTVRPRGRACGPAAARAVVWVSGPRGRACRSAAAGRWPWSAGRGWGLWVGGPRGWACRSGAWVAVATVAWPHGRVGGPRDRSPAAGRWPWSAGRGWGLWVAVATVAWPHGRVGGPRGWACRSGAWVAVATVAWPRGWVCRSAGRPAGCRPRVGGHGRRAARAGSVGRWPRVGGHGRRAAGADGGARGPACRRGRVRGVSSCRGRPSCWGRRWRRPCPSRSFRAR
jgi:hypothetical protein